MASQTGIVNKTQENLHIILFLFLSLNDYNPYYIFNIICFFFLVICEYGAIGIVLVMPFSNNRDKGLLSPFCQNNLYFY